VYLVYLVYRSTQKGAGDMSELKESLSEALTGEHLKELVKSFEAVHQSSEWETLRWVLQRIEAQLGRARVDPQADGYSVLRGLIEDIDKRMGVKSE
jgi:hypothetical protein